MNTPELTPTPEAPATRRSWRTPLFVLLFLAVATASYLWRSQQLVSDTAEQTSAPIAVEPGDVAAEQRVAEEDPMVQQLTSVSTQLDTATIRAELADTTTENIDAEMENISAETSGL